MLNVDLISSVGWILSIGYKFEGDSIPRWAKIITYIKLIR